MESLERLSSQLLLLFSSSVLRINVDRFYGPIKAIRMRASVLARVVTKAHQEPKFQKKAHPIPMQ